MSCNRLLRMSQNLGPAPFWHRIWCKECRKSWHADKIISFAVMCRKAEPIPGYLLGSTLAALDLPQSLPRPLRDRIRLFFKRIRKPAAAVAGLSLVCGYGWLRYIDIEPAVHTEPRVEVNPNAYRDYVTAASLMKDVDEVTNLADARFKETQPQSSGVSKPTSGQAAGALPPANVSAAKVVNDQKSVTELVRVNRDVLGALRNGLARQYQAPDKQHESYSGYHEKFRKLALLLRLEAEYAMEKGDWSGAMSSSLDAIQFGSSIQSGGILFDKSTGILCEEFGRNSAWKTIDHLSLAECASAIDRLNRIEVARTTFVDALRAEKRDGVQWLMSIMNKPGWRWSVQFDRERTPHSPFDIVLARKKDIIDKYVNTLDLQLEQVDQPYGSSVPIEMGEQSHDLASAILPATNSTRVRDLVDQVENSLLKTSLALRIYRLKNGGYPEDLAKLVPKYIGWLPSDPFIRSAQPGAFGYYRTVGGYVLYSIGPDGVNDHGTSVRSTPQHDSVSAFRIQDATRGDIVAGVDKG